MAPTDATYFYMTDQRATDRTQVTPPPAGTPSSSTSSTWRYAARQN